MKKIVFYRTATGVCPVKAFLESLPGKQAQKALWVFRLIERMDSVPTQYFKKLVDSTDVWEVRTEIGGNALRFLGFLHRGKFLILAHAFCKKTQKTPLADIRLAEQRRLDYLRRIDK
jgi:phage-related protein